jgi:hypothetical protein
VAVYPSLGSYSVVGLFWWTSPPFRRLLILPSIMCVVGWRVFQGSNQCFVNLHKTGTWFLCSTTSRKLTPPLIPTGRGKKRTLIRKLFYFCSFAQIHHPVFVQYLVLKNPLHYYPLGSGFCYPILRKNYFLSLIPNERGHF